MSQIDKIKAALEEFKREKTATHISMENTTAYVLEQLKPFSPSIKSSHRRLNRVVIEFSYLPEGLKHKLQIIKSPLDMSSRFNYKWNLVLIGYNTVPKKKFCRYYATESGLVESFKAYYISIINNKRETEIKTVKKENSIDIGFNELSDKFG